MGGGGAQDWGFGFLFVLLSPPPFFLLIWGVQTPTPLDPAIFLGGPESNQPAIHLNGADRDQLAGLGRNVMADLELCASRPGAHHTDPSGDPDSLLRRHAVLVGRVDDVLTQHPEFVNAALPVFGGRTTTALHLACREGSIAAAALLLGKFGADPDSRACWRRGFHCGGEAPLHAACVGTNGPRITSGPGHHVFNGANRLALHTISEADVS